MSKTDASTPPVMLPLPYHRPRLEFFGHVVSLTRGSFSSMKDDDKTNTDQPAGFRSDVERHAVDPGAEPWLQP